MIAYLLRRWAFRLSVLAVGAIAGYLGLSGT